MWSIRSAARLSAAKSVPVRLGKVPLCQISVTIWIAAVSAAAQEEGRRFDVGGSRQSQPSSAAIEEARREVRQAYDPRDIAARLQTLIHENQARPARVYVLISMAADYFVASKQFTQALGCFHELSQRLNVDGRTVALESFASAHAGIESFRPLHQKREASESLFLAVRSLIDNFIASEDYAGAEKAYQLLGRVLQTTKVARSKKADEFSNSCEAVRARLDGGKNALAVVPAHKLRLQASAQDRAAIEFLGLYSCLYANDWKTGLDHLRNLESGSLRAAARADIDAATFFGLSGGDAYEVAKAWKQVSSDERLFGSESLWSAAQDSIFRREWEWLDRAVQLEIDNQIDRNLAWKRRAVLRRRLGFNPHAIVGTWVILTNSPGWRRTFGEDGQVIARDQRGQEARGTWRPVSNTQAEVQTEFEWKWVCTLDEGNRHLLVDEYDPERRKKFSIEHRRE